MIEKNATEIFDPKRENSIILLCTNVLGFGANGPFKRLRLDFPEIFNDYRDNCLCFATPTRQEEVIGKLYSMNFGKTSHVVVGYAQRFFSDTKYEIDYDAWDLILQHTREQMEKMLKNGKEEYTLHIPYKIAVGMKPEDVEQCRKMVEDTFQDSPINVVFHI